MDILFNQIKKGKINIWFRLRNFWFLIEKKNKDNEYDILVSLDEEHLSEEDLIKNN